MSELKRCGCGKVPKELHISENGQGGKYATCAGSCCGDWETEFRCDYAAIDSDECMEMAVAAWNGLKRDETIERQGQKIVKQAEQIQRMEANRIKLVRNLAQACGALLEIADYADKEPFDMRDLRLIAIASDCLGVK